MTIDPVAAALSCSIMSAMGLMFYGGVNAVVVGFRLSRAAGAAAGAAVALLLGAGFYGFTGGPRWLFILASAAFPLANAWGAFRLASRGGIGNQAAAAALAGFAGLLSWEMLRG